MAGDKRPGDATPHGVRGRQHWYRTCYDFAATCPSGFDDRVMVSTSVAVSVPIATRMSLDVNGRYVFMQKDANNIQVPTSSTDFWNLAVGLAISSVPYRKGIS
jgi:hypothetical protein